MPPPSWARRRSSCGGLPSADPLAKRCCPGEVMFLGGGGGIGAGGAHGGSQGGWRSERAYYRSRERAYAAHSTDDAFCRGVRPVLLAAIAALLLVLIRSPPIIVGGARDAEEARMIAAFRVSKEQTIARRRDAHVHGHVAAMEASERARRQHKAAKGVTVAQSMPQSQSQMQRPRDPVVEGEVRKLISALDWIEGQRKEGEPKLEQREQQQAASGAEQTFRADADALPETMPEDAWRAELDSGKHLEGVHPDLLGSPRILSEEDGAGNTGSESDVGDEGELSEAGGATSGPRVGLVSVCLEGKKGKGGKVFSEEVLDAAQRNREALCATHTEEVACHISRNRTYTEAGYSAKWEKVAAVLKQLPKYEWVVWADCDVVLLKPAELDLLREIRAAEAIARGSSFATKHLMLTRDFHYYNLGFAVFRSDEWTRELLLQMWHLRHSIEQDKEGWRDQKALGRIIEHTPSTQRGIHVLNKTVFNAYPAEVTPATKAVHYVNCWSGECRANMVHAMLSAVDENCERNPKGLCQLNREESGAAPVEEAAPGAAPAKKRRSSKKSAPKRKSAATAMAAAADATGEMGTQPSGEAAQQAPGAPKIADVAPKKAKVKQKRVAPVPGTMTTEPATVVTATEGGEAMAAPTTSQKQRRTKKRSSSKGKRPSTTKLAATFSAMPAATVSASKLAASNDFAGHADELGEHSLPIKTESKPSASGISPRRARANSKDEAGETLAL